MYRVKFKNNSIVDRYKARLVIKGCSQRVGVNYTDIFNPVSRFETTRVLLSVIAINNLHLRQFDIKTAFLYEDLQEHGTSVLQMMDSKRVQQIFVYTSVLQDNQKLFLLLYVGDGLVATPSSAETADKFLDALTCEFKIKVTKNVQNFSAF